MGNVDTEGRAISKTVPLEGLRKMIADRMTRSINEFPQGTASAKINTANMRKFREEMKEKGLHITFGDMYVKAAACAMEQHMELNGARIGDELVYYDSINIGVMASINGVLMEPVLFDVQDKDIEQVSEELKKTYEFIKKGRLMKVKLEGSTFSVSNLGMYRVDNLTPMLSPPRMAILGIGCVRCEPAFDEEGKVVPAYNATLNLTVDHGAVDGVAVAEYLKTLEEVMNDPWKYMYSKRGEKTEE